MSTGQPSSTAHLFDKKDGNLTIRQLYTRIAGSRGHNMVIGVPECKSADYSEPNMKGLRCVTTSD